jgi:hypothetical protein
MDATTENSTSFFTSFNFQRIVLTIAIIILIASMIFIGYSLYYKSSDVSWPPETPKCPDYWSYDKTKGKCIPGPGQPSDTCEYNGIPGGTEGVPKCPSS